MIFGFAIFLALAVIVILAVSCVVGFSVSWLVDRAVRTARVLRWRHTGRKV